MEIDSSGETIHPYGQATSEVDGLNSTLELPICSDGELNPSPIIHIAEDSSSDSSSPIISNWTESE